MHVMQDFGLNFFIDFFIFPSLLNYRLYSLRQGLEIYKVTFGNL